jgi:hypothetical protein
MKRNGELNQEERIIRKLLRDNFVTRNECLRGLDGGTPITRLSHYANLLAKKGWVLEGKYGTKNKKDYGYVVKHCPLKTVTYTLSDGREINKISK